MESVEDLISGVVLIVWYAAVCIGTAGCLRKAEREQWRAYVPVLNAIEICRLAGFSGWILLTAFLPMVNLAVTIYVALKFAQRFEAPDSLGVALGLTGFGLLPAIGLGKYEFLPMRPANTGSPPNVQVTVTTEERPPDHDRERRTVMIFLSIMYGLALLSVPGFLVIGTMAFAGISPDQRFGATVSITSILLSPVSLIIALAGGWVLHKRGHQKLAVSLAVLPMLHVVGFFVGFAIVATKQ